MSNNYTNINFESSHQFKCWILFQLVDVQLSQRFHTKQATIIVRVITDIVKVKIRWKGKARAIETGVKVQVSCLDALQIVADGETEEGNL